MHCISFILRNSHCFFNHFKHLPLKNNTTLRFFAILIISCLLLPGCSLFIRVRQCTLTTRQDDTQVQILGCKGSDENGSNHGLYNSSDFKDVKIINKKGNVTLTTFKDFYVVNQSKSGYIPTSDIIYRSNFNPIKGIDIILPAISDLYLLSLVASTTTGADGTSTTTNTLGPVVGVGAILTGTLGWLNLCCGPWKTFPKTYELPALQKFPRRDTSENRVYIREANISLEKYSFVDYYYKNYKDYLDGNEEYRSTSKDEFKYRNSTLKDTLNNLLGKWSFADTSAGHLGFMYNSGYYIKCDLTGAHLNTVKSLSSFSINCDWKLFSTISDKPAYTVTLKTSSKWGFINSEDNTINDYLKDAFVKRAWPNLLIILLFRYCWNRKRLLPILLKHGTRYILSETIL